MIAIGSAMRSPLRIPGMAAGTITRATIVKRGAPMFSALQTSRTGMARKPR